jgi:hypothetical protein
MAVEIRAGSSWLELWNVLKQGGRWFPGGVWHRAMTLSMIVGQFENPCLSIAHLSGETETDEMRIGRRFPSLRRLLHYPPTPFFSFFFFLFHTVY